MSYLIGDELKVEPVFGIFRKKGNGDYSEEKIVMPPVTKRKANYVEEFKKYKTIRKKIKKISDGFRFVVEFTWEGLDPEYLDILTEIANLDKRFSSMEEQGYIVVYPHHGNSLWKEEVIFDEGGWNPSYLGDIVHYDNLTIKLIGVSLRKTRPTANNLIQAVMFPAPVYFSGIDESEGGQSEDVDFPPIGSGDADDEIQEDTSPPIPINAYTINSSTIEIIFNEIVDSESAEEISNYTISDGVGGLSVINAVRDVSGTKVVLTTEDPTVDGVNYVLTINGVKDLSNNPTVDVTIDFIGYGSSVDSVPPQLLNVQALTTSQVLLTFDKELDQVTAEDISNYSIVRNSDGATLNISAASCDVANVLLTTDTQQVDEYSITVNGVKDLAGNATVNLSMGFLGQGTIAPVITDIAKTPSDVRPTESVLVTARVSDDGPLQNVRLKYNVNYSGWVTVTMSVQSGDIYQGTIPAQSRGDNVRYKVRATDADNNTTESGIFSYYVGMPG